MVDKKEMIEVFVWPDYSYCHEDELEGMLMSGFSDDYYVLLVPLDVVPEDLDQFVIDSKCQDFPTKGVS